jgi:hypothetical protein
MTQGIRKTSTAFAEAFTIKHLKRLRRYKALKWNELYISTEEAEENPEKYFVVFEEDNNEHPKMYDLTKAIFEDLDVAKAFIKSFRQCEPLYVTRYSDYISGNYDYL